MGPLDEIVGMHFFPNIFLDFRHLAEYLCFCSVTLVPGISYKINGKYNFSSAR